MPVPSSIADLSATPSSNSPAGSETPSSTDDYLRTVFAFIKQTYDAGQSGSTTWAGTAGGTANAITLTPSPAITAYGAGQVFRFKSGATANSGATTIAISGLAAIALNSSGAACVGGEIAPNRWYEILITSPTNAQLQKYSDDGFVSGTRMLFQQSAAPVGWTKDVTHNNKALRIVSGSVVNGGTVDFTTAFASQSVSGTVGNTTLSSGQIPVHQHIEGWAGTNSNATYGVAGTVPNGNTNHQSGTSGSNHAFTSTSGSSAAHNHGFTGTAIDMEVAYVDFIIAEKD